jgi:hypothetical protein
VNRAERIDRSMHPLFQAGEGGSIPTSALLRFTRCSVDLAVDLCRRWHSRLPRTQSGPWQFAFAAEHDGRVFAVALWNTPSGRCLPQHWLELRRMACAPDAPKNTASRFLSWMVKFFKKNHRDREKCISYQDTAVHTGTIYRAAGWVAEHTSTPRVRDRSGNRAGTNRMYRWNINGVSVDASPKIRWACKLDQ